MIARSGLPVDADPSREVGRGRQVFHGACDS
jgi:hypothetical protein